jgi:hypothetical protein
VNTKNRIVAKYPSIPAYVVASPQQSPKREIAAHQQKIPENNYSCVSRPLNKKFIRLLSTKHKNKKNDLIYLKQPKQNEQKKRQSK